MPAVGTRRATTPRSDGCPRRSAAGAASRRLLDAAARLVVEQGVEALTTRDIAEAAGVPVASLYQYFADKEDVLLALAERDMAEMDDAGRRPTSPRSRCSSSRRWSAPTMLAFVTRLPPAPRLRGDLPARPDQPAPCTGSAASTTSGSPTTLRAFAIDAGLRRTRPVPEVAPARRRGRRPGLPARLRARRRRRPELIEEGIVLVTAYLERYATPAGPRGRPPVSDPRATSPPRPAGWRPRGCWSAPPATSAPATATWSPSPRTGVVLARLHRRARSPSCRSPARSSRATLAPTSELDLHLGVYADTGAAAVVHTHAPFSTAVACVLDELPVIHYQQLLLGGAVRVAPYATFGTPELAAHVRDALADRQAALMANHGSVADRRHPGQGRRERAAARVAGRRSTTAPAPSAAPRCSPTTQQAAVITAGARTQLRNHRSRSTRRTP